MTEAPSNEQLREPVKRKPSVNPVLWDFMRAFEKVGESLREVGGFSEILKISLRVLEGFQSVSEDALVLEVVRKRFQLTISLAWYRCSVLMVPFVAERRYRS